LLLDTTRGSAATAAVGFTSLLSFLRRGISTFLDTKWVTERKRERREKVIRER
jgi:hypothetical protein